MGAGIRSTPTETVKLPGRNRQGLANDLQLIDPLPLSHTLAFLRSCANALSAPTTVLLSLELCASSCIRSGSANEIRLLSAALDNSSSSGVVRPVRYG